MSRLGSFFDIGWVCYLSNSLDGCWFVKMGFDWDDKGYLVFCIFYVLVGWFRYVFMIMVGV